MSELEHFGVKGMKWGVRKDRSSGSSSSSSSKAKTSKSKSVPKGKAASAKKPSKKSNFVTDFFDADKRVNKKVSKLKEKTKAEKAETARKRKVAKAEDELSKARQQNSSNPSEEERTPQKKKDDKTSDRSAPAVMRSNGEKKYSSASSYSDNDLKQMISRMEMEKKYSALIEERRPKTKAEKLKNFAKSTATNAIKNEGQKIVNAAVGAGVSYGVAKAIGDSTVGDATTNILSKVFGGGKKKGKESTKPSPSASQRQDRIQNMLNSSNSYLDSQRNNKTQANSLIFSGSQASSGRSPAGQRAVSIISKYAGSKPKTYTFGKSESVSDSFARLNTNLVRSNTLKRPYPGPSTSLASRQGFDVFTGNKRKKR